MEQWPQLLTCRADHPADWRWIPNVTEIWFGSNSKKSGNVMNAYGHGHTHTHTHKWETGETWVEKGKNVEKKGLVQ